VPYYQFIRVKNPNVDLSESILRSVVTQTPGILELSSFTFDYTNQNRTASVELQAKSTSGDINFAATVGGGA